MNKEQIENLTTQEVDEEYFRELMQWEKKDLVNSIISETNTDNKRAEIKGYFDQEEIK